MKQEQTSSWLYFFLIGEPKLNSHYKALNYKKKKHKKIKAYRYYIFACCIILALNLPLLAGFVVQNLLSV